MTWLTLSRFRPLPAIGTLVFYLILVLYKVRSRIRLMYERKVMTKYRKIHLKLLSATYRKNIGQKWGGGFYFESDMIKKSIIWVMLNLRFRKNWKFSQNLNAFADRGVGGRTRRDQVIICRRKCMRKITLNFLVVFMLISCFEIRSTVALRVVRLRANSCTVVLRP